MLFRRIKNIKMMQFALVISEQAFRSGSNMIMSVLLGRVAPKDDYGAYTLLFSAMLVLLDIQSGLTRMPYVSLRITKDEKEKKVFLGNTLIFHFLISLMFILISVITAIFAHFSPIAGLTSNVILLFSGATVAIMLREFLRQVLLASLDNKSLLIFGIIVNGSIIVSTVLLYVVGLLSLKSIYILIALSSVIPSIGLIFTIRHKMDFDVTRLGGDISDCVNIGKWLVGRALLSMFSGPMVLNSRLAATGAYSEVAMYGACMVPTLLLSPLLQALDSYILPRIANAYKTGKAEVKKIVSKFNFILLITLILFNSGVYLFSNQIMQLAFNGKYLPPALLLLLFTFQMSILLYAAPVAAALIAMKNTRSGFLGEIIAALTLITFGLPLVCYYGIWGLAGSLVLSKIANRGFQIYVYNNMMKQ